MCNLNLSCDYYFIYLLIGTSDISDQTQPNPSKREKNNPTRGRTQLMTVLGHSNNHQFHKAHESRPRYYWMVW